MSAIDHIKRAVRVINGRAMVGRLAVESTFETAGASAFAGERYVRAKYVLTVETEATVPENAIERNRRTAEQIIIRELYGPLRDELHEIWALLMEENHYRPGDDAVRARLERLLAELST